MNCTRMMNEGFGTLIRKNRYRGGLSQLQLASLANISPSYVSRIERGERLAVNYQIVLRLRNILNISMEDIYDLDESSALSNKKSMQTQI